VNRVRRRTCFRKHDGRHEVNPASKAKEGPDAIRVEPVAFVSSFQPGETSGCKCHHLAVFFLIVRRDYEVGCTRPPVYDERGAGTRNRFRDPKQGRIPMAPTLCGFHPPSFNSRIGKLFELGAGVMRPPSLIFVGFSAGDFSGIGWSSFRYLNA